MALEPDGGASVHAIAGPRRPRVVHLCTRYLRGGSERRVRDVVAALPDVDHVVVVGAESDSVRAQRELAPARIVVSPDLVRPIDPRRDARCLRWLLRLPDLVDCDLVYTHQSKAGVLGRLAVRLRGGPPVVHSLSMATFGSGYGRLESTLQRLAETALVPMTAGWVVVGADLAEKYRRIGADPSRLHVVRSGAPLPAPGRSVEEARAAVARDLDLDPQRPLLLYLGSLDERKNVLALPEVLASAAAETSVAPCMVVAGEGPLAEPLAARFAELGLAEQVRMPGYVSPVDDLLLAADVVVLLSRAEGLPQVLLQAAAAGTPFVAHPVDGVTELLALGAIGRVVARGDPDGVGRAIAALLTEQHPPEPAPGLGSALAEWSPETIRQRHRDVFTAVTGRGRVGRKPPPVRGPLVLEFLGLPGAGKSTIAAAVAAALAGDTMTTAGTDAGSPAGRRLRRKLGAVAAEALARPASTAAAAWRVARSGQDDVAAVAHRTVAWLVAQRLVARARASGRLAVLDEGTLQATWSLGLAGDHRALLDAWVERPDRWRRPDLVVVLRPSVAVVEGRLAGRADPHSRIERVAGDERRRLVARGSDLLDDLVSTLGALGLPADAVLEVPVGAGDRVRDTTAAVLDALAGVVPGLGDTVARRPGVDAA